MQSRQQRRAAERAHTKAKTINATAITNAAFMAFSPSFLRAAVVPAKPQDAPEPVAEIAIDCNRPADDQPPYSSNALQWTATQAVAKLREPELEDVIETKRCDKCRKRKSLEAFSRRGLAPKKNVYDGHHAYCKLCVSEIRKRTSELAQRAATQQAKALASQAAITAHMASMAGAGGGLGGGAEVETATPINAIGTPRKYTPTGWPVDEFQRSAKSIRNAGATGERRKINKAGRNEKTGDLPSLANAA